MEKERVYDFLVGLNTKYNKIRVQVLGKILFPSFKEAYSNVHQKESKGGVMLYTTPTKKAELNASGSQE